MESIKVKHERQKQYAEEHLQKFEKIHFMFWSPKVPVGIITKGLNELHEKSGLEPIINNEYAKKVALLKEEAKKIIVILEIHFLESYNFSIALKNRDV